jgi:transcriptional regulator with XRE-family HTH domain
MAILPINLARISMPKPRAYSNYARQAAKLLGKRIKLHRKQRKWTEQELAERAGIARATLRKIEKGEMNCVIGSVFEVAALVGVRLFDADDSALTALQERTDDRIALLPQAVRGGHKVVEDDF